MPIEIKWAGLDRGTAGRLRLVRGPVHSDNRLSATLMMGLFATGVATSWTEAGTGGKDALDTFTRREGRFRR